MTTFATAFREMLLPKGKQAEIAQLVEHDLTKVGVAGSSPVFRSFFEQVSQDISFLPNIIEATSAGGGIGRRARFRCVCREACRFESCSGHISRIYVGEVAELVDALL